MIAKRVVALVIAVTLVVISIVIRSAVTDDGDAAATSRRGPLRLTCADELAGPCEAIARNAGGRVQLTVEAAGATAQRLLDADRPSDVAIDGWLTLAPWPEIVAERRERANAEPLLDRTSARIARSPLVLAVRKDRHAALTQKCGGEVDWTCIGRVAGSSWSSIGGDPSWGAVKPAHPEAVQSATGLLVLGQAAGHYLASPDVPVEQVSRTDWEASDTFGPWFQQLETSVPPDALDVGADPFARWLQLRGVNYAVVGGLEAQLGPGIAHAGAVGDLADVIYPAGVASADVVLAPIGAGGSDLVKVVSGDEAAAALAASGWRVPGQRAAAGVQSTALPESNGLPPAGTLDALQDYWQDVVR